MTSYTPLFIYISIALLVPIVISIIAGSLGRKSPEPAKYLPYESGYPTPPLMGRFSVKFYLIAMLFVVFDVEAVAFYPWAITLRELGPWGFYAIIPFLLVFIIGDLYVWKKGGFEWK